MILSIRSEIKSQIRHYTEPKCEISKNKYLRRYQAIEPTAKDKIKWMKYLWKMTKTNIVLLCSDELHTTEPETCHKESLFGFFIDFK